MIHDKDAIQKTAMVLDSTQGFDIVHENGADILDSSNSKISQELYVQPVIRDDRLDRALGCEGTREEATPGD